MKFQLLISALYGASLITAAPPVVEGGALAALTQRSSPVDLLHALEKRKGGGGGGGKGGGGSSSGGSSSGGKSSGSSGGSSGSSRGSGTAPAYGNRYAGGATTPYRAGSGVKSPARQIAPYAITGAAVGGFGAYYATPWIYPVYGYYYPIPYHYTSIGRNHSSNVTCLCQSYQDCGCDPDDNESFLAQILANSSTLGAAPVNSSIVRSVEFANGSAVSFINGSLENGTTPAGSTGTRYSSSYGGYAIMVVTVLASVFMA